MEIVWAGKLHDLTLLRNELASVFPLALDITHKTNYLIVTHFYFSSTQKAPPLAGLSVSAVM